MIVIYGDTKCLCLEENLERFFEIIDWAQNHECLLEASRRVLIDITKDGLILQYDEELSETFEICSVNEFFAFCKTCDKKARSSHEYEE